MSGASGGTEGIRSIERLVEALADRYVIERELGAGGMATVYVATDVRYQRQVALKVLRPELASALGPERFAREIGIAARLNHPHIVPVFDSGTAAGFLFYVMPFVRGETLRHRLERENTIDLASALRLSVEVCEALHYAHREGIVHRDIKPENILLSEGHALIADFGLAHAIDQSAGVRLTTVGFVLGTPAYMSPEQASGEDGIDGRSDQYSLACVVHELLTGSTPFRGPNAMAFIAQHLTQPPPSVCSLRPDAPETVDRALQRALSKDVESRFASLSDMAQALHGAIETVLPTAAGDSVAVLDFLNISGEANKQWLSGGIAETVSVELKRVGSVRVVRGEKLGVALASHARPVMSEDDAMIIARSVNARWFVWGTYQTMGDSIRIAPRFGDTHSGAIVASTKLDGAIVDVFALQDRIVTDVMHLLELEESAKQRARIGKPDTNSLTAYELFARARQLQRQFTPATINESRELLLLAIARDPGYALAHSGLGYCYAFGYIGTSDPQDLARAITHLERALELDPDLGEAYAWLCYAYSRASRLDDSVAAGMRAVQLEPDFARAHYFLALALWVSAQFGTDRWPLLTSDRSPLVAHGVRELFAAVAAEPGSQSTYQAMADFFMCHGQYADAAHAVRKAVEVESGIGRSGIAFVGAIFFEGRLAMRAGDMTQAQAHFTRAVSTYASSGHLYATYHVALSTLCLGEIALRAGEADDALIAANRVMTICKANARKSGMGYVMIRAQLLSAKASFSLGVPSEGKRELMQAERAYTNPSDDMPLVPVYEANPGLTSFEFASAYALSGQRDVAMQWLERAFNSCWNDFPALGADPSFTRMRNDPLLVAFVDRCQSRSPLPASGPNCTGEVS